MIVPLTIVTYDAENDRYKVYEPELEAYTIGPDLHLTHAALLSRLMGVDDLQAAISFLSGSENSEEQHEDNSQAVT